jgi:hypothetical protein
MKTPVYISVKYSNVSKLLKMQDIKFTLVLCSPISERVLSYFACLIVSSVGIATGYGLDD